MRHHIMKIIMITLLFCGGCYNLVEIDDTIGVVAHGLDVSPDGKGLISTAQLALPLSSQGGEEAPKYLVRSAQAAGFHMADEEIGHMLPRLLIWDMAETYIVGETIARHDISLFLDHLARIRLTREGALLFLAYHSTPHEVLKTEAPPDDCSGLALAKTIRAQEDQTGLYSPVSVGEFLKKTSAPGIEPVLPQVVIEAKDGQSRLKINGLAVFLGRHMVGSLDERESRGLRFMKKRGRGGLFIVNTAGGAVESQYTLELLQSEADIEPITAGDRITMQITIRADGNLYELDDEGSIDSAQLDLLEEAAGTAIRSDVEASISKAQALHSDIFGWGQAIRSKNPELWSALGEDWPLWFSSLPYEIKVDYKLRRTYLGGEGIREH